MNSGHAEPQGSGLWGCRDVVLEVKDKELLKFITSAEGARKACQGGGQGVQNRSHGRRGLRRGSSSRTAQHMGFGAMFHAGHGAPG